MDAVLEGRMLEAETCRVGEGMLREGEVGESGAADVARVFSHEGGFCGGRPMDEGRRRAAGEPVSGVSLGLRGELFGVEGRSVLGDCGRMEPGRRKGDWRGLLKESGEGL